FGDTRIGSTNEVPENTMGTSSTTRMGPCEVIAVTVSRLPLLSSMVDTAGLLRVSTVCDAPVSINMSAATPLMAAVTMRGYSWKHAPKRSRIQQESDGMTGHRRADERADTACAGALDNQRREMRRRWRPMRAGNQRESPCPANPRYQPLSSHDSRPVPVGGEATPFSARD